MTQLTFRRYDHAVDWSVVARYHKEHHGLNFPGQKLLLEDMQEKAAEAAAVEPEGMNILTFENMPCGFLWLQTMEHKFYGGRIGIVRYVHLDNGYRGKGLSHQLMAFADQYFLSRNVSIVELGTHVSNEAAINLYKSHRFEPYRLIMIKRLS